MSEATETLRYESAFPIANQLRAASSHQQRAQILLQLSDAALLGGHVEIEQALGEMQFPAGATFVMWRVTALCRTRDAHGLLPDFIARELEQWRELVSRIAGGAVDRFVPLIGGIHGD